MARSLSAILNDDANHDPVCAVLDKLQDDVKAQAAKASRPEMEVVACVWLTLTRVMAAHGANVPAMLGGVVAVANSVIAENAGSEPTKPTVH